MSSDFLSSRFKHRDSFLLSAAFLSSLLMALFLGAAVGLAPFGDRILVFSDSENQFTSFWAYWRNILLGESDPMYSLQMTMGGNAAGLLGYYAGSPLNFLFLLFPVEKLPLAVHLIALIKIGLCGLCMAIYLKYTSHLSLRSLIFTLSYSFCGFNISYFWCLMWLDSVFFLPLIALGIHFIFYRRKPWLYIFSLAAAIISNYYTGFMLCIASVLYFLYLLILDFKAFSLRRFIIYAVSSLTAAALSAFILLPSIFAMEDGKMTPFSLLVRNIMELRKENFTSILNKLLPSYLEINQFLSQHILPIVYSLLFAGLIVLIFLCRSKKLRPWLKLTLCSLYAGLILTYCCIYECGGFFMFKLLKGYSPYEQMLNGFPGIYSGITVLALGLFFFFSKDIDFKEKLAAGTVMLIMIFSLHCFVLNLVWHGFTKNNSFNYRYTFIFSFFLIVFASKALVHLKSFSFKYLLAICLSAAFLLGLSKLRSSEPFDSLHIVLLLAELFLVCLLLLSAAKSSGCKVRRFSVLGLSFLTVLSLFSQAFMSLKDYSSSSSYSQFYNAAKNDRENTEFIKEADKGLYRASISGRMNGPMMFAYNGLSHFSSNESSSVVKFLSSQGLASMPPVWASGLFGRTSAFDCLYGIKYLKNPQNPEFYQSLSDELYINPLAFPLAFCADSAVFDTELSSSDALSNQNSAFKALEPELASDVFSPITDVSRKYLNLEADSQGRLVPVNPDSDAELILSFCAQSSQPVYLYNELCRSSGGELYVNGEFLSACNDYYDWRAMYLGSFNPGDTVELSCKIPREGCLKPYIDDGFRFYHEDSAAIKKYRLGIEENPCKIDFIRDSHMIISADVRDEGKCLLLTIPYNSSWKLILDGNSAEAEPAFGIFMAVPLSQGIHTLELKFTPPGLISGLCISLLSLAAVISAAVYTRRKT